MTHEQKIAAIPAKIEQWESEISQHEYEIAVIKDRIRGSKTWLTRDRKKKDARP